MRQSRHFRSGTAQKSKQARFVLTTFGAVLETWNWYRANWDQADLGGISEKELRSFAERIGAEVVETEERRRG